MFFSGYRFIFKTPQPLAALKGVGLSVALSCLAFSSSGQVWQALPERPGIEFRVLDPSSADGQLRVGFESMDATQSGVDFKNTLSNESSLKNSILNNGSGVAIGDVNGDGLPDFYLCALEGPNHLYLNQGPGSWKWERVKQGDPIEMPNQYSTGATMADVDGDNDLDILVTGVGAGVALWINDGSANFTLQQSSGLDSKSGATSMALADVDQDGDVDLYVANYRTTTLQDMPGTRFTLTRDGDRIVIKRINGEEATPEQQERFVVGNGGQIIEAGEVDQLYLNDGKGKFSAVDWTSGRFLDSKGVALSSPPMDWGLTAAFQDINLDGLPDLFVANDAESPDRFWINQGKGVFKEIDQESMKTTSLSSMGLDFADVDLDGDIDFLVLDMLGFEHEDRMKQVEWSRSPEVQPTPMDYRSQVPRNTLQLNQGDGRFIEAAMYAGVTASDWAWSPIFMDVDLDGFSDLLISNGFQRDVRDMDTMQAQVVKRRRSSGTMVELMKLRSEFPSWITPNHAFRNLGQGKFEPASEDWNWDQVGISNGMALGDLDQDGDLDVVISQMNGAPLLMKNLANASRLAITLRSASPNSRALGARLTLRQEDGIVQQHQIYGGGRYLSSDEGWTVFAVTQSEIDDASNSAELELEIQWPDGSRQIIGDLQPNHAYRISQTGEARLASSQPEANTATKNGVAWFEDVTEASEFQFQHIDPSFPEERLQAGVPRALAYLGPSVAWVDFNGDQLEDIIMGPTRGTGIQVWIQRFGNRFSSWTWSPEKQPSYGAPSWWQKAPTDGGSILASSMQSGSLTIWSSLMEYEGSVEQQRGAVGRFEFDGTEMRMVSPYTGAEDGSSTSSLATSDFDGDGDLDLFMGGRLIAGQYPEAASSMLYINRGSGAYQSREMDELEGLGMVTSAVWSDLDANGFPELILSTEMGSIRVFQNIRGKLIDITARLGFINDIGLWNAVETGDINGDGLPDIIATNFGLNHPLNTFSYGTKSSTFGVFWKKPESGENMQIVEAWRTDNQSPWKPWRDMTHWMPRFPEIRDTYPTHSLFAEADLAGLLDTPAVLLQSSRPNTFASAYWINQGLDQPWTMRALPIEAQMAPAFGLAISDFDGDGHQDLVLAQNDFHFQYEYGRQDAGSGLVLQGDGKGNFKPLNPAQSGVLLRGAQRAVATADYNRDGRVDLLVTQNSGPAKLFQNKSARPGLRVRLLGPPENPLALGASVRLGNENGWGPVMEVKAGAGHLTQNSSTLVLTLPEAAGAPDRIEARWPGGYVSQYTWKPKGGAAQPKEIWFNQIGRSREIW